MNIEFLSFLTISFFIAITPGPSVIYVVSYSLRYGAKAGILSTIGINLGSIIAIFIAAFGLSSIVATYPLAIIAIQILGGFFILYLAVKIWPREPTYNFPDQNVTEQNYINLFRNGFITSILNPKDILFYIAFIPTFIPEGAAGKAYQSTFLILGFAYMSIGFITKSLFSIFSGYAKQALESKNANLVNYLSSITLFVLGVYLLVTSCLAMVDV